MDSDLQKLRELIKDVQIAMVTTVEPNGMLHTRPLATLRDEHEDELWFFTAIDSAKAEEVELDPRVSVAYANQTEHAYVAVSGSGEIVRDRAKMKELWTPMVKAWFPEGLDDPNLGLLHVRIERAEFWTSPGKPAFVLGVAKAALTGKPTKMGDNRKLTM